MDKIVTFKLKVRDSLYQLSFNVENKNGIINMFYKNRCLFYENVIQNINTMYIVELEYFDNFTCDSKLERTMRVDIGDFESNGGYSNKFSTILDDIKEFIK